MGKLLRLSGRDVARILAKHGFAFIRQRGSHMLYQKHGTHATISVTIPDHKEIAIGTLVSIIQQSGLERAAFESK